MKLLQHKVFHVSFLLPFFSLLVGISFQAESKVGVQSISIDSVVSSDFAKLVSPSELRGILSVIASDSFMGREAGQTGQKLAAAYIANFYKKEQLVKAVGDSSYFQTFTYAGTHFSAADSGITENVVGFVKGSELSNQFVVISAHYDHLGIKNGKLFNGADDDGSGTSCLLAMAKAFSQATKNGYRPKRSIVFIAFSGEEKGLLGSNYYSEHPLFPFAQTMVDLNIDMVGRHDKVHRHKKNYVYLIGSTILSKQLDSINQKINHRYIGLNLDYTYNSVDDPNHYYYRSDHYNFAKNKVPVIFYFNGVHEDYHKPTDKIAKIDFELMAKRAQLIFHTAWELANRPEGLKLVEQ